MWFGIVNPMEPVNFHLCLHPLSLLLLQSLIQYEYHDRTRICIYFDQSQFS